MIEVGGLLFPDGETHFQSYGDRVRNYGKRDRLAAYAYVKAWRCAVDIGANVGIFSCDFAARFDKVIAFEPMPATRDCLAVNVPANVCIEPYAISNRNGALQMYRTPSSGASFVCNDPHIATPFDHFEPGRVIEVQSRTLDSFDLDGVDLIKLDIQGAEYPALCGARETILKHRPVVMVEEKAASVEKVGAEVHDMQMKQIAGTAELLQSYGMTPAEKIATDRIYIFG